MFAAEVESVEFDTTQHGYDKSEVDDFLERLGATLMSYESTSEYPSRGLNSLDVVDVTFAYPSVAAASAMEGFLARVAKTLKEVGVRGRSTQSQAG